MWLKSLSPGMKLERLLLQFESRGFRSRRSLAKALNNVKFQFADFTNLVYDKIETERYIAIMSNKYNTFLRNGLIS